MRKLYELESVTIAWKPVNSDTVLHKVNLNVKIMISDYDMR